MLRFQNPYAAKVNSSSDEDWFGEEDDDKFFIEITLTNISAKFIQALEKGILEMPAGYVNRQPGHVRVEYATPKRSSFSILIEEGSNLGKKKAEEKESLVKKLLKSAGANPAPLWTDTARNQYYGWCVSDELETILLVAAGAVSKEEKSLVSGIKTEETMRWTMQEFVPQSQPRQIFVANTWGLSLNTVQEQVNNLDAKIERWHMTYLPNGDRNGTLWIFLESEEQAQALIDLGSVSFFCGEQRTIGFQIPNRRGGPRRGTNAWNKKQGGFTPASHLQRSPAWPGDPTMAPIPGSEFQQPPGFGRGTTGAGRGRGGRTAQPLTGGPQASPWNGNHQAIVPLNNHNPSTTPSLPITAVNKALDDQMMNFTSMVETATAATSFQNRQAIDEAVTEAKFELMSTFAKLQCDFTKVAICGITDALSSESQEVRMESLKETTETLDLAAMKFQLKADENKQADMLSINSRTSSGVTSMTRKLMRELAEEDGSKYFSHHKPLSIEPSPKKSRKDVTGSSTAAGSGESTKADQVGVESPITSSSATNKAVSVTQATTKVSDESESESEQNDSDMMSNTSVAEAQRANDDSDMSDTSFVGARRDSDCSDMSDNPVQGAPASDMAANIGAGGVKSDHSLNQSMESQDGDLPPSVPGSPWITSLKKRHIKASKKWMSNLFYENIEEANAERQKLKTLLEETASKKEYGRLIKRAYDYLKPSGPYKATCALFGKAIDLFVGRETKLEQVYGTARDDGKLALNYDEEVNLSDDKNGTAEKYSVIFAEGFILHLAGVVDGIKGVNIWPELEDDFTLQILIDEFVASVREPLTGLVLIDKCAYAPDSWAAYTAIFNSDHLAPIFDSMSNSYLVDHGQWKNEGTVLRPFFRRHLESKDHKNDAYWAIHGPSERHPNFGFEEEKQSGSPTDALAALRKQSTRVRTKKANEDRETYLLVDRALKGILPKIPSIDAHFYPIITRMITEEQCGKSVQSQRDIGRTKMLAWWSRNKAQIIKPPEKAPRSVIPIPTTPTPVTSSA